MVELRGSLLLLALVSFQSSKFQHLDSLVAPVGVSCMEGSWQNEADDCRAEFQTGTRFKVGRILWSAAQDLATLIRDVVEGISRQANRSGRRGLVRKYSVLRYLLWGSRTAGQDFWGASLTFLEAEVGVFTVFSAWTISLRAPLI